VQCSAVQCSAVQCSQCMTMFKANERSNKQIAIVSNQPVVKKKKTMETVSTDIDHSATCKCSTASLESQQMLLIKAHFI